MLFGGVPNVTQHNKRSEIKLHILQILNLNKMIDENSNKHHVKYFNSIILIN